MIAIASALLVAGCGSAGAGAVPPSPSTPPRLFDLAVSERDTAVTMHVGQTLEVVLHSYNGLSNWTQPKSGDASVLSPIVNPAATAVRGVTLAAFRAKAPGAASVTATSSPICPPNQACPMYVAVYSLKVTVTP